MRTGENRSPVDMAVGAGEETVSGLARGTQNRAPNKPTGRGCCVQGEPHSITVLKIITTNLFEHLAIYEVVAHVLHFASTTSHTVTLVQISQPRLGSHEERPN